MTTSAQTEKTHDSAHEWRRPLAIFAGGMLLFLTVSGLLIWGLPFSEFPQFTVLTHTGIGLITLLPVVVYCIYHWRVYRARPLTPIKLLGYFGLIALVLCTISGVVLTVQASLGTRIEYLWRSLHRWTTVALVVLGAPHLFGIVLRDLRARATEAMAPVWSAEKRYLRGAVLWTVLGVAVTAALVVAYRPPRLMTDFPKDYELWEPSNPKYGKNRPFAPSLAQTKDNKPLDSRLLSGGESCGTAGCHVEIVKEWLPSAHRYSAMDKAFQAVQKTMADQNGPTSTRYCAGCHDPISLFSGQKTMYTETENLTGAAGFHEGVSCLVCHSVKETDLKGNANYQIEAPPRYVGELECAASGGESWRSLRDFLIRAYPDTHQESLSKRMFKKPEYCAACHKQFVDEEINKVGWVQLQNQFDNWKNSKWARHRDDPTKTIECRECHMPLTNTPDPANGDLYDYNRSPRDGRHRSHRFIAANQLMPALLSIEGAEEQIALTEKWLKGQFPVPEIEDKWAKPGVPVVSLQLIAPETVKPGEKISLQCVITSNKVGHDFPTGPLDIIQAWLEVIVTDDQGKQVFASGTVDDEGFIQPGSFIFKAEPVDQYGNLIDRHNLWEMVGVRHRRALFPGFSDTAEFSFFCPISYPDKGHALPAEKEFQFASPDEGVLHVKARLRYRKVDQFLLNFLRKVGFFSEYKGQKLTSPITDLDQQGIIVHVGA